MSTVTGEPEPAAPGPAGGLAPGLGTSGHGEIVVALAQIAPRLGDVAANLDQHCTLAGRAIAEGAHLVVFPELSLTGYFLQDLVPDVAVRLDGDEVARLAAASTGIDAVVGCVLEGDDARFYNAMLYLSGGRVHHVHRKVYLPTYGLFDESRYFASGSRFRAFEMPLPAAGQRRPWRAGTLICEDLWHPSAAALLARQNIEVFLCPSASPARGISHGTALGTARNYDAMTCTYAQLFTAYVVYCNRVGYEDGVAFWGGSRIVGPDGHMVTAPAGGGEELTVHRLSLAAVRRVRVATPLLRDERHDINEYEHEYLNSRRAVD
jgi:predicted amidohydrolase